MDRERATAVIKLYDDVVIRVAATVAETFPTITTVEDATQDARLMLLSYAGLVDGGRHPGKLDQIAEQVNYDQKRISKILSTQIRLDLSQEYGRELESRLPETSLERVAETTATSDDFLSKDLSWEQYPYLVRHYRDRMTGQELADADGVDRATVTRRIAREKRQFLINYITSHSKLIVEGDESMDDLTETYGHLKRAGR